MKGLNVLNYDEKGGEFSFRDRLIPLYISMVGAIESEEEREPPATAPRPAQEDR